MVLGALGCEGPARTTRTEADDLVNASASMAEALLASAVVAERRSDSERWVIVADRMQNLSSEVITASEQRATVRRIVSASPLAQLEAMKNIVFVVPMSDVRRSRETGLIELDQFAADRRPTHTLSATFNSATRLSAKRRTDAYYVTFEIIDLQTGQRIWQNDAGFKRAAVGHIWD